MIYCRVLCTKRSESNTIQNSRIISGEWRTSKQYILNESTDVGIQRMIEGEGEREGEGKKEGQDTNYLVVEGR